MEAITSPRITPARITPEEQARRRKAVRNAFRTNAIEGLAPNPKCQPVFDGFVAGEFDLDELGPRLDAVLGLPRRKTSSG